MERRLVDIGRPQTQLMAWAKLMTQTSGKRLRQTSLLSTSNGQLAAVNWQQPIANEPTLGQSLHNYNNYGHSKIGNDRPVCPQNNPKLRLFGQLKFDLSGAFSPAKLQQAAIDPEFTGKFS